MSLRVKFIWSYLVVITTIFVINQGYHYYTAHQSFQSELIKEVRVFAHNISHSIKDALGSNDKSKVRALLNELHTLETVADAQLYSNESNTIILSETSDSKPTSTKTGDIFKSDNSSQKNHLYIVEPIMSDGTLVANLGVTLVDKADVGRYQMLLKDASVLLASLIIGGVILYIYLERTILKPLQHLSGAVQELTYEHTKYVPVSHHSKDEIGELIDSFDRMMVKLLQREKQRQHSLEALKQKSLISQDVVETIQYSLIITDSLGTIIHCNSSTCNIFNKNNKELVQTNIRDLIKTKTSSELNEILSKGIERSDITLRSIENQHLFSLTSRSLSKQGHLLFEIRDVTEFEEVQNRERIAGRIFESSQDGLVVINDKGFISMVNPAVNKMLGGSSEQFVGQSFVSAIRSQKLKKLIPSIIKSIENYGIWQGEIVEQSHSGQFIPLFAKVNRILKCEKDNLYDSVIVLTDLSDVKEMERLEYLTHHDPLTGLANRSKFNLIFEELIQRSAYVRDEFALLFLDLDGFKAVNDTYGHDAGDEVLKIVANRMASVTRHTDLIARLAGDEFVMLINPANQAIVTRVSEQLLEKISTPISYKSNTLNVGVSIGVKLVGLNERDAERVLKSADTAMYQAKKSGKGRAILMGYEL